MKRIDPYEDFESDFDHGEGPKKEHSFKRMVNDDLSKKPCLNQPESTMGAKDQFSQEYDRIERQRQRYMAMDVYSRHKELINNYVLNRPGATSIMTRSTSNDKNDYDFLKKNHRFLWDEDELNRSAEQSWEFRLAKRYYENLFKEYCIADLSQYKKNRIALRWRIENEVRSGKGQFECGNKRCTIRENLTSWEVNFGYVEKGEKKNALIKLRLCFDCSGKLNFHSQKRRAGKFISRVSSFSSRIRAKESSHASNLTPQSERQEQAAAQDNISNITPGMTVENEESKKRAGKMMEIWTNICEEADPERSLEEELDDFLDDIFV